MIKLKIFLIGFFVFLISASASFAQEILPTTNTEKDVAVLNDELRKLQDRIAEIEGEEDVVVENEIQTGMIVMWGGAIADIPTGWNLCDGTNGTVNLTDRFVIHADADSGGTNDVGDTGGSHTVTLTEAQLPSHSHGAGTLQVRTESSPSGGGTTVTKDSSGGSLQSATTSNPTGVGSISGDTGATGSGSAVTITPKYYALAYIQYIGT